MRETVITTPNDQKLPLTVDEYIKNAHSSEARQTLSRLREIIRSEIPEATELISYKIPTFKLNKTSLSFACFKSHCSLFPGSTLKELEEQIKGFKLGKATIQFPHDQLPDEELIRKIVRARFRVNWP